MIIDSSPTPSFNIDYILLRIWQMISGGTGDVLAQKDQLLNSFHQFYLTFAFASTIISFFLLLGIAYSYFRIYQIRTREALAFEQAEYNFYHKHEAKTGAPGSNKWQQVEAHIASGNPQEWRLAILEADIILDELVYEHFGGLGTTLGERLKNLPRGDFKTIDKAWEAHRIRNAIAHEGSSYELSEREMKNIIKLYEEVFAEFNYI